MQDLPGIGTWAGRYRLFGQRGRSRSGGGGTLSASALTQSAGFVGVGGIFRLRADGTTDRGLAVAQIQNSTLVIVEPAPNNFGGAGF